MFLSWVHLVPSVQDLMQLQIGINFRREMPLSSPYDTSEKDFISNKLLQWRDDILMVENDLFRISLLHFICTLYALNTSVYKRTGTRIKIVFAKGWTILNIAVNTHQLSINNKFPPGSFFHVDVRCPRGFLVIHMTDLGGS